MTTYEKLTEEAVASIKQARRDEKAEVAVRSVFGAQVQAVAVEAAGGRMGIAGDTLTLAAAQARVAEAQEISDRRIASAVWDATVVNRVEQEILGPWLFGQEQERARLEVELEDAAEDGNGEAQEQFTAQLKVTDALIAWGRSRTA